MACPSQINLFLTRTFIYQRGSLVTYTNKKVNLDIFQTVRSQEYRPKHLRFNKYLLFEMYVSYNLLI